jgi:hypothetical protein
MPHYALAGHVFVCLQGEHVVFLDVRNDRYFALEAQQTGGLEAFVPGWPVTTAGARAARDEGSVQSSVIALLLERGLLSADVQTGKPATPVVVPAITDELTAESHESRVPLGFSIFWKFLVSALIASCVLKFRGFERAVRRVSDRNERRTARAGNEAFDKQRVHALVAAFATFRPFFFTTKDMCLFEALALAEFLARHGVLPRWIFGVQARPFAAHCWLQHRDIVLNDTADHVSRYTPIMIV